MTLYTMTNKEAGAVVRKALKDAGIAARDCSVTVRDSGYNTAVRVKVKNPRVKLEDVRNVVNQFEEIDRDERTGEILSGCNVYMFVEYADGIFDELGAEYMDEAREIIRRTLDPQRVDCTVAKRGADYLTTFNDGRQLGLHQGTDGANEYRPHKWHNVDYPQSLAVDLWRFYELGTIYA